MRVLHVITDMRMGGAERALVRLALATQRAGHSVGVVALKRVGAVAEPLLRAGVAVKGLGAPDVPGAGLALSVALLAAELRRRDADVVHAWLASGCAAVKLAAPVGLPRIYAARVTDVPSAPVCALLGSPERSAHAWVAVSNAVAERWARALGRMPEEFHVVPNGLDVRAGVEPEPPHARPVVLARLSPQKGLDVLVRAVAGTDLHVDVYGEGPEEPALRALSGSLGVDEQVLFHGLTDAPEEQLRAASMLVLPSRSEGMPNVVLESMAAGRAVVATRIPGTTEVVTDGVEGLLVPPDDPVALRGALLQLNGDAGLRRKMGRAGHARVRAHFDHRTTVEATLGLYDDVTQG